MQRTNQAPEATLVKERDLLRFTTAGSVDDGKSTLIGRMLFDSKQIFQDQLEQLEHASRLRGEEQVDLALLTDGLRAEREQGITIDVAYRYFSTSRRKFIIADTPGHEQYTRNMVTGASTADLAILLIDARNGVLTQSKRHGIIASLLGIPHVVVCVNKMDLVDYSRERYEEIVEVYKDFAQKLNIHDIQFIPVSALVGDNVVDRSDKTPWYNGPPLLQFLETVTISADRNLVDFRFPVQYVIRPHQDFRGFAGTILSGTIRPGEEIIALPSMQRSRVKTLTTYQKDLPEAAQGDAVTLTLEDEIDISRGDMIVRRHNIPQMDNEFEAVLCWMDERHTLSNSTRYVLQHTTRTTQAMVEEVAYQLDVNTLHRTPAKTLELNEIGRVKITSSSPLFFDPYDRNRWTGGFILIDPNDFRTVAAGMIRHTTQSTLDEMRQQQREDRLAEPTPNVIQWDPGLIALHDRVKRNQHPPLCIWLTGVSGAGKSAIAHQVEKQLFDNGKQVVRIDTENLKGGLNRDLDQTRRDRREAVRRAGHLARTLYDLGNIVICSFVSPDKEDRDAVRALFPKGDFIEVQVEVSMTTAKHRDPRGLYKSHAAGETLNVAGLDVPYEAPDEPEIKLDAENADPTTNAETLVQHILDKLA